MNHEFEVQKENSSLEELLREFQLCVAEFEATVLLWDALNRQRKDTEAGQKYSQTAWEQAWDILEDSTIQYVEELRDDSQRIQRYLRAAWRSHSAFSASLDP